jgi:F0F1-type ATP synthase assembly protein I
MGRLITFVVGVLVGVVLKWHYDEQATPTPAAQPAGRTATTD